MKTDQGSVLIVDDDLFHLASDILELQTRGFDVRTAETVAEAKQAVTARAPDIAVLDMMMPMGAATEPGEAFASRGGFRSGQVLAQWIKVNFPSVQIVGMSVAADPDIKHWFTEHTAGFFSKLSLLREVGGLAGVVERVLRQSSPLELPTPFIVHGHDDQMRRELKDFLQNTLGFPEPIVLHEHASLGRTILEKFEDKAEETNLVFVLLTPDDLMADSAEENSEKRRARQNVIFELGYFLGKLGRHAGSVLLLYKGPLELPSDISGLVYIDISRGIEAAGERIRRELRESLGILSLPKLRGQLV